MNSFQRTRLRSIAATVLFAAAALSVAADAHSAENPQKLSYSADGELTMTVSDNVRTLNLSENVIIIQGTLRIVGDLAVLEFDEPTQELIKATVFGAPVRYTQGLDSEDSEVEGTSDSIQLVTEESTGVSVIELTGNAYIQSPDTTMQCAAIVYLPDSDLIRKATGPCAGTLSQE